MGREIQKLIRYPTNRWHSSSAAVDCHICISFPRTWPSLYVLFPACRDWEIWVNIWTWLIRQIWKI